MGVFQGMDAVFAVPMGALIITITMGVSPWERCSPMGSASRKALGYGAEGCVCLGFSHIPPGSPQGWRSSQQGMGQC